MPGLAWAPGLEQVQEPGPAWAPGQEQVLEPALVLALVLVQEPGLHRHSLSLPAKGPPPAPLLLTFFY